MRERKTRMRERKTRMREKDKNKKKEDINEKEKEKNKNKKENYNERRKNRKRKDRAIRVVTVFFFIIHFSTFSIYQPLLFFFAPFPPLCLAPFSLSWVHAPAKLE